MEGQQSWWEGEGRRFASDGNSHNWSLTKNFLFWCYFSWLCLDLSKAFWIRVLRRSQRLAFGCLLHPTAFSQRESDEPTRKDSVLSCQVIMQICSNELNEKQWTCLKKGGKVFCPLGFSLSMWTLALMSNFLSFPLHFFVLNWLQHILLQFEFRAQQGHFNQAAK